MEGEVLRLKQLIAAEGVAAAKERFKMGIEDILSCTPLDKDEACEVSKVNAHTVWLEWTASTKTRVSKLSIQRLCSTKCG